MPKVEESWHKDPALQQLLQDLQQRKNIKAGYYWEGELLKKKSRLVMGKVDALRKKLINLFHVTTSGGNLGSQVTYKRLQLVFIGRGWIRM